MYIADLHIHSRYSRATSRDCTPEYLDLWARKKGIDLLGTGDFTHPAWRQELSEKLVPAEDGLYVLKEELQLSDPASGEGRRPRFVVSGEISSIYKKNGQVRKVHNVILLPGLEPAERLAKRLETIGNIHSDGRSILGLDCRDLLEITLEICPDAIFIPAHIWTPHFSMFGAFSKFQTVEECFEDLTPYIHAMETGLSSDPPMNWRLSALDRFQLISNSDAHSPAKLGREANLMDIEMSYQGLFGAIQEGCGLKGTIEFFPEEGKYHYDGHRKCHICLSPGEASRYRGICPVCGKKLTLGVSHRISQLADREEGFLLPGARPFESLVPLPEVVAASIGASAASRKVQNQYETLLRELGNEFSILREIPVEDIRKKGGYFIAEGIRRLREGRVDRLPGFDGEYGTIKLFEPAELDAMDGQMSLFFEDSGMEWGAGEKKEPKSREKNKGEAAQKKEGKKTADTSPEESDKPLVKDSAQKKEAPLLNPEQQEAVESIHPRIAVIAGPGTGKTKTLVSRILYLLQTRRVKPSEITAVTFTNQAAEELKKRLEEQLGGKQAVRRLRIGTFHSICHELLQKAGREFLLADREMALELAEEAAAVLGLKLRPRRLLSLISARKTGDGDIFDETDGLSGPDMEKAMAFYASRLAEIGAVDFDDLLLDALALSEQKASEEDGSYFQGFHYLLVDEFQDTSPLQYRLIRIWNRYGRELFVIGAPDQAIYGFRGADSESFRRLEEESETRIIRLKKNYRSTPQILAAAEKMLEGAKTMRERLEPVCGPGCGVRLAKASGERNEAIFIAKEINRLVGGMDMLDTQEGFFSQEGRTVRGFGEIAVLYRTHRQAALLETCLKKEGIPYVAVGREEFLDEASVRGTLSFFRSLLHPEDTFSVQIAKKLLWNGKTAKETELSFRALTEQFLPLCKRTRPQKLLDLWIREMEFSGDAALEKLISMAVLHKTMEELLYSISFGKESDIKRCGQKTYTSDAVTLMTLHGSKGLEYPVVFINGARKGRLPLEYGSGISSAAETEEERRLFYVGMTRAKEELILTASGEESPFLTAVPGQIIEREQVRPERSESSMKQLSLFDFFKDA